MVAKPKVPQTRSCAAYAGLIHVKKGSAVVSSLIIHQVLPMFSYLRPMITYSVMLHL